MTRPFAAIAAALILAGFTASQRTEHVIGQSGRQFSRAELTIRAGESVIFRNDDTVIHNVFSTTEGFTFNLRSQAPGSEAAVPFRQPGTAAVRCAFHPQMRLTVTVR
jgi:plastocyanin